MLRCSLPAVVVSIMLKWYTAREINAVTDLKDNLRLLAVCRVWRYLAIPMVYSRAYVYYEEKMTLRLGRFARNANVEMPVSAVVETNLDLIAMTGCSRAVSHVDIDVRCKTNPLPGWRDVIQRMTAVASKWRTVGLAVGRLSCVLHFVSDDMDISRYADDIAEVGDALTALMPNIHSIDCSSLGSNPIARSLYDRLAGHYAGQLRLLSSRNLIVIPPDCRFTRLQRVYIGLCHDGEHQLPRMASEELVDVNLAKGVPNHSWAPFSAHSGSWEVSFTKLQRLQLDYCAISEMEGFEVRHGDGHPWRLHFPSLNTLILTSSADICPPLEYAVLPRRMELVSISMPSAAYLDIADIVLPATETLIIAITSSSGGDPSGLPIVNRIIENARGRKLVGLKIEDDNLPVVSESITCTVLTTLRITGPVGVDTMLAFIKRMPRLVELMLTRLDLNSVQTDISVPEADTDASVDPLSTSISQLLISFDRAQHSPDTAVAVAKYVLLGIRTLACLTAAQISRDEVLQFVSAYTLRHPHLSSVRLGLYEGMLPHTIRGRFSATS